MEKKETRRKLSIFLVGGSIFFILFLHLQQQSLPSKSTSTIGYSRKSQIWHKKREGTSMKGKEAMKFHLRRLARGKNLDELDSKGMTCYKDFHFDQCIINKQVIIQANQPMTLYVPSDQPSSKMTILPYARREDPTAMKEVTPLEINLGNTLTKNNKNNNKNASSYCQVYHKVPAMIFSSGGFIGNMFHELNEIIIPLFITSWHFNSQVQFVISDYAEWWVKYKYDKILEKLSSFEVVNGDEDGRVHCFPGAVVGLRYHDNLALNSSDIPGGYTMTDFRYFIEDSYNLTLKGSVRPNKRPKILLITRKDTRVFLNEDEMVKMMLNMGFDVHKAQAQDMIRLNQFVEVVNACDIIVGAHGAGLTNAVFLRDRAVVIQIVPLALDWAADTYFKYPSESMGLKYIEYKIGPKESSLYEVYGPNHPIISKPLEVFEQGYRAARAIYIHGQNITIDITRFRETLSQALKFLKYPIS